MMKKFKMVVAVLVGMSVLTGCQKDREEKATILTTLDNVNIVYINDTGKNNIIPIDVLSNQEIKNLKVKLKSLTPMEYESSSQKADIDMKIPDYVWYTNNDFDWQKAIDIMDEKDIDKLNKYGEYENSFSDKYETTEEKSEIAQYFYYQANIALSTGFDEATFDDNEITEISIYDGEKLLLSKKVNIRLLNKKNSFDDITPRIGAALGLLVSPSNNEKFTYAYELAIENTINLKSLKEFNDNTSVKNVDIKIERKSGNKTYRKLDPNKLNLALKKGDKLTIAPMFELKEKKEKIVSTRNYVLQLNYEKNGQNLVNYVDSGVVMNVRDANDLYYFNSKFDATGYLRYLSAQTDKDDYLAGYETDSTK